MVTVPQWRRRVGLRHGAAPIMECPLDLNRHHEHLQKPYVLYQCSVHMSLTLALYYCSSRQSLACVPPYPPPPDTGISDFIIADDPNAAEVVKISEGQLFLVRSETVRGGRECMCVISHKSRFSSILTSVGYQIQ